MSINCCDVCGTQWDPSVAEHRRGVDCAAGLAAAISGVTTQLKKALKHVQDLHDSYEEEKEHTINAFKKVTDEHQKLLDRFDNVLKRVTLLEHPELNKISAVKKAAEKK